jgi:tyrosyl-DNA phosphodiesterase 2
LHPYVYSPSKPAWRPFEELSKQRSLGQGALLKIVSWNIDFMCPGQTDHTFLAMSYLKERFGDLPPPLAIMLQEITCESLRAILAHQWVKDHFAISEIEAPQCYFTLMMVSRDVPAESWFRVPFSSNTERDALVVEIPVSSSKCDTANPKKIVRLCTTHLESLPEPEGKGAEAAPAGSNICIA